MIWQDARETKNGKVYHEVQCGGCIPHDGMEVSEERLAELSGSDNKQGVPLIELVQEKTDKKTSSSRSTTKKTTAKAASK